MSAKLTTIEAALGRLGSAGQRTGASVGQLAVGFGVATIAVNALMGAAGAIAGSFVNAGKGALDLSSRLEQARIGFTTMLGSAQKADQFIGQLQQKAESTAFSFPGLQQVAQSFLAMGVSANNVIPLIDDVSNALSAAGKGGDTDALQRVGASLSEIAAQGKITGEQIREMSRNGIAVLPLLAEAFGKTTAEVRKMAENGEISANMFFEAFHSEVALHYGDIQAQQAKTWAVAISNVGDILGRLSTQTFKEFFGALTQGALLLTDFLHSERAQEWSQAMQAAIHDVMAALAPLGAILQGFVGGSGVPAVPAAPKLAARPLGPSPDEVAKAMSIPSEAIKSAKDYDAQIKIATADIHNTTEALTALGAQQDALKAKIEDTTKIWDLRLTGLKDQQAAIGVEIEATKTRYEGILDPLNRMQAQLQRLGEDTKASFSAILDPLKSQLFDVNRQIADSKTAFESVVRPIQSQIDAITRANAALAKQRDLVIRIADLNLRESQLKALGDPGQRGDIAARLQALQFTQDDLERQKELLDLANKKGQSDKQIAAVQAQLDANRTQQIKLEQEAANLVNRGLTEQNTKQGIVNDAAATGVELAQKRADIEAQKQIDPLQAQLDATQARLKAIVDPLEAQAAGLSRAIEDVGIKEAAALAPITAAQESVARKIQDTNQALQEALKPLEAASKAVAAQITAAEAAKAAALAPLKDELEALDRKSNALELHKRQQADLIAGWKDEKTAIAAAAEELAKNAPKLDLSGGSQDQVGPAPGDAAVGPDGRRAPTSPAAQFPKPPTELVKSIQDLSTNLAELNGHIRDADAAAKALGLGGLVDIAKGIGALVVADAASQTVLKLAGSFGALAAVLTRFGVAGTLVLIARQIMIIKEDWDLLVETWNRPGSHTALDDAKTAWDTFVADQQTQWAAYDINWDAFWKAIDSNPALKGHAWTEAANADFADFAAGWDAWNTERTVAWNKFWADLGPGLATELSKRGAEIDAQFAAWKTSWDAWDVERTASWNTFWAGLGAGAQAGWDTLTGWLEPAVTSIVKFFDPLAKVLVLISDAVKTMPTSIPGWIGALLGVIRGGGGGGAQQVAYRPGQGGGWMGDGGAPTADALAIMGLGPQIGNEIERIIKISADRWGIDYGTAIKVALSEGGLTDPVRQSDIVNNGQREQSYGPFQLNINGGLGATAMAQGLDPRNPAQWREVIDFALKTVSEQGWGAFHGAAAAGIGNWQGVGAAGSAAVGATVMASLTPLTAPSMSQYQVATEAGLSADAAAAFCGPYAAMLFANATGHYPTAAQAQALAAKVGWTPGQGMAGIQSELALMQSMGLDAVQQLATPSNIDAALGRGAPVAISTPRHYFEASGGTAEGGLNVGATGTALAGGKSVMTLDEISALGGGLQGIITLQGQLTTAQTAGAQAAALNATSNQQLGVILANGGQVAGGAAGPLNALAAAQQQTALQAQTFATQQENLTKVLQGQADPLRNTKEAMTEFGSVLGPIERQVAGGTVGGLEGLQKQLVDLARATGLATKPWADYTNGLITIDEAMARVINQASDAGPEFDALRKAQTANGADATTTALNFLQAALHYRDAQAAIAAAPVVPAVPPGAAAAAPATLDTGPIKAVSAAWDETKAKADAAGLSVRAYQDIVNILDYKQITAETDAWNTGTEAVNKFSDAAHQIGDYLDSHEFHFKATFDAIPSDYKPGSPSPLENALRGIIDAGHDFNRMHLQPSFKGSEPLLSPAARQGALASSGGGGGGNHYHITIEGSVLTEDQLLTRFRNGLIKHSRRNAGQLWD